jgi:hypothetical protein
MMKAAAAATLSLALGTGGANALTIKWTDWTSSDAAGGFTAYGTITSGSETIDVTYTNSRGVDFIQTNGGTDYWTPRGPSASPYTSVGPNGVDNAPTGTDLIALAYAGEQTLTFSKAIANPVFSFVSLNGNGYGFLNQDFEILSYTGADLDGNGADAAGYWGSGTVTREVVDLGGGDFEYQLNGAGEPHGTIRFTGAFDTLTWSSRSDEAWNGFTVGIQGTAEQVFAEAPLPAAGWLLAAALGGLAAGRRRS